MIASHVTLTVPVAHVTGTVHGNATPMLGGQTAVESLIEDNRAVENGATLTHIYAASVASNIVPDHAVLNLRLRQADDPTSESVTAIAPDGGRRNGGVCCAINPTSTPKNTRH